MAFKHAAIWVVIAACVVTGQGCKKKEPTKPNPRAQFKERLTQNRYRKPVLIFNNSKKEIRTIALFYDDEGIVIRNLKPGAGVEELLLTNSKSVTMQYFITFADKRQVVVPRMRWNFTPAVATGISIEANGTIIYK